MRIKFKNILIENFKSIGEAVVDFDNQGIVKVLGDNSYEANASSNGAGKSSIFMALFWSLYGKDPKGISNPQNRYTNSPCNVVLDFEVDSKPYQIIRYMKGATQNVVLMIDGIDRSARNRSDTDKIIRDDILKMSSDIFLSLVYLSQGFSNRLTALTPSARKDRLEQLTNTSDLIESFNERLSRLEEANNNEYRKLLNDKAEKQGFLTHVLAMKQSFEKELTSAVDRIDYFEYEGVKYYKTDLQRLQSNLDTLSEEISVLSDTNTQLKSQRSVLNNDLSHTEIDYRKAESDKSTACTNLASVTAPAAVCPTCHQSLANENAEELAAGYREVIMQLTASLSELDKLKLDYQSKIDVLDAQIAECGSKLSTALATKQKFATIKSSIPEDCNIDVEGLKTKITELSDSAVVADTAMASIQENSIYVGSKLDVIKHCRQLVTKSFRAYLLESAVKFLNSRLAYYSSQLFSNSEDIVRIDADSSKLEIYQGSVLFDTLSGGEERKADLAVVLAQRDLAAEIAGTTCNILILDEIMESMDEKATQVTLSMLEKTSETVDSLFIISHNNYAIPADATLTVTKHEDRVASIQIS